MRNDNIRSRGYGIFTPMIRSAILGNLVTLIALAISALLIWRGQIPEEVMSDLVIAAVFTGGIISGFAMCKKDRKGIFIGALGGLSYFALMLIIGAYRVQGDVFSLELIRHFIAIMAGSMFGGAILMRKKSRKRVTKR